MAVSASDKVNAFLLDIQSLSEQQFDIVIALRQLFLQANTALTEEIKY